MIKSVVIEHFKSIATATLELGQLTVLVGPNSSGKSNIIDVIRFIKEALVYDLDRAISERHGIDSIRQWAPFRPYHVSLSFNIQTNVATGYYTITLGSQKGNYVVLKEEGEWKNKIAFEDRDELSYLLYDLESEGFEFDARESIQSPILRTTKFSRNREGNVEIHDRISHQDFVRSIKLERREELFLASARYSGLFGISNLTELRRELTDFEAYSIFPNTLKSPQTPSNETELLSTGENLTSIFRSLPKSRRGVRIKEEILSGMRLLMPNLENILIQTVGGLMVPSFRVTEADNKLHDFNVSQVSDGFLRVLGLLTALYQPQKPKVIALEEPEQTVNPGVLALLADVIKAVSHDSQIIVTTHSPEFVDKFEIDNIRAVDLVNGVTKVTEIIPTQRKAVRDRLFSLGELMSIEGFVVE